MAVEGFSLEIPVTAHTPTTEAHDPAIEVHILMTEAHTPTTEVHDPAIEVHTLTTEVTRGHVLREENEIAIDET